MSLSRFLFRTVRCSVEERSAGVRRVTSLLKTSSVSMSATPSLATHVLGASFRLQQNLFQAAPCPAGHALLPQGNFLLPQR